MESHHPHRCNDIHTALHSTRDLDLDRVDLGLTLGKCDLTFGLDREKRPWDWALAPSATGGRPTDLMGFR